MKSVLKGNMKSIFKFVLVIALLILLAPVFGWVLLFAGIAAGII